MTLIVMEADGTIVALVENYQGPVPRAGECIHHPRGAEPAPGLYPDNTISVKQVAWGIIARPKDKSAPWFTGAAEPFVEVTV